MEGKTSIRVLLAFFASLHISSGLDCPAGWDGYGNSCYKFVVQSLSLRGLNWENARRVCLGYGGDLVSVANKSEMNFVYSKSSKAWNKHFWIGLNDRRNESQFVWSDGTPYNRSVYSNWYPGEPNDRAGEDCVELYGRRWNDNSCKKEYSYICERPKGAPMPNLTTVTPPVTSSPIACPAGWVFYGSSCYKFSSLRKKWIDAKKACRASGGYLLKINNADEQHFITYRQSSTYRTSWIGLSDAAVEGSYRWESDNSLANYTHWGTEEPNDFAGLEDCVAVWGGASAGFWNDDFCDSEKYYICEKPGGRNLCPLNWRSFGDYCYQFNVHGAQYKNWVNAEKACMSYNGSTELISISSAAENAFVLRQLKDMRISQVWIGLNDRKVEGRYEWSDKSSFAYKNWSPLEPSTGVAAKISDCTVIDGNTQNGTWSTSPCFFRRGYICKRKIGINQCDSPFGMEDGNIADDQISASSSWNISSGASQARLRLTSGNLTVGAWCAAQSNVGEYLQIDLGVVRQVKHLALQGRPGSSDYVKTFYLKYGDNGLDFNSYGENATVKYKILTANINAITIRNIVLAKPINARFIRIYPLTWNSRICVRTEIYGCASQASSKKCGVGWEVGPGDTCYQINSNQRKLWADARATCISRGGELVSIVSMTEKNWLNNRLKALSGWAYSFWLGLNSRDFPLQFYWSDRSPYKLTAWDSGYPTNTPKSPKACVEIDSARGAWRDVSCGEYRPFICKRKMASTNGVKFPATGNWISATDYYWPLNTIVDGKALGTVPATVRGNVTTSDRVQNGRDVLYFRSYQAYLDAGQIPVQCITDPDQCSNGITVSFVVQFEDGAKTWTRNTFIVDTIGDERLLNGNRGFAVYVINNRLYVTVVTRKNKWTVSQPLQTGTNAWQHVMFTWQLEKGLVLYKNGTKSTSLRYGASAINSGDSSAFTVGSKSTQSSSGGFLMRSLAVWRRALSSQEVSSVYLAEFGSCRAGWKDFGQYCYQFNLVKKSWSSARVSCVNQQADLVSIHSPVEQAHITLETGPYGLQSTAWIGLHDQGVESEFQWSDGTAVQFTNWDAWQPDDWRKYEDCANMRHYNDGRWNDQTCWSTLPYICKRPKEYIPPSGGIPTTAPQKLFVCEWTSAVLSCPLSTVLSIRSAIYGRTDASRCGQISVTDCKLNVTSTIIAKCGGKNYCSLKVTNGLMGSDPCVTIPKYLEIDYVCKSGRVITPGCPGGWQHSPDGSRCFGVMFDRKNWQDARRACKSYGADLASLHSSTENIMLTSLLIDSWDIADIGGLWIGLTDAGQRGVYNWSDGSSVDYSSWLHGQPDERDLSGSCVQATLQPGRMNWLFWQDVDCGVKLPYACAILPKNKPPPTTLPTTVSKNPCPSGWMLNGSYCYKLMPQSKTWTDARDACRLVSANTNLVSIHNLAENAFVANLFNRSLFAAWIGLSDRGVLFGHVWSDKSPVEFTNWNPQQPDSHQGQQPCVEMYSTGDWADTGCYSVKQFICKMPRSDNSPSTALPTTSVKTTQAPDICPPGWILWNTMCYYFANKSQSSKVSWRVARQACQSIRGGDLVSILSAAENNFIKSKIAGHSSYSLWIGLNDLGTESSYQWSDGSPVVYRNYGWREPNDYFGQEDCLEFLKTGYWNDHHCSVLRPYICKKTNNSIIPAFTMFPPTPGPTLGKCKDGWVNYDKSCYRIVSDPQQTWQNARDVCRKGLNTSMNGDLVTVNDQYEQAFLTTLLLEKKTNFWIGLNDMHVEGSFFWTDNSPRKYTNWNVNEPQNWGWSKDCVDMTPFGIAGRWGTVQCSQNKGFICETGALPLSPTTGPTSAPKNSSCPPHYVLLGDDCYFVSYVKLSWKEAREACQRERGGDLISVHGAFEQAFVVLNLKNFRGGLWLGLSREANSPEFTWSDHSITLYTNWATNQPDALRTQKTCVVANNSASNAGGWSDVDCSDRNGFVCRIRQGEPHVSPPLLGSCPSGWEKFEKNCYLFQDTDLQPWTAARFKCQNQGANLVSITSQQEQDFITFHYQRKSAGNIWTGLNDRALERGFSWSDGSPVNYLNWLPGEPNDNTGMENCIEMWPPSRGWNDQPCGDRRGYICKQPLECSGALGMVSGAIDNSQITASSSLAPSYGPGMARLNALSAWCASNGQSNQYIQVDLLTETRLTKIAIQGFNLNAVVSFVKTFTVQTSDDGVNYNTYQKNGKDWVFVANRDANSVVTLSVQPTVDTRLIRIVPGSWTGSLCVRMEFYGCPYACQTPLGMQSGALKDSSLSASSFTDNSHKAANARPSSSVGWCSKTSEKQPWLQISFPDAERKITKITTWGGGKGSGFVKVYRLAFTDVGDNTMWSDYKEGGRTRNFRGNQDAVNPVSHLLAQPIITLILRVKPQSWSAAGACLRLELFGCENGCNSALGLRQGVIENSALSASSSLDQAHAASQGRLNGSTGWCASDDDKEPSFVVDLGKNLKFRSIATQGAKDGKGYIKSFTVSTRYDTGSPWTPFKQNDKVKVFLANVDSSSVVKNTFVSGVRGRYFKIVPVTSNIRPCLRLELYGCETSVQPTAVPTTIPSERPAPPKDVTYTGSVKLSTQEWTDDLKSSTSAAFKSLAGKLEKSITDLYTGGDEASLAFLKVNVTGFRRGSVVAIFNLTFIRDIADDLGDNVTNNLVVAVKSGNLGGMAVDPDSLNVTKVAWNGNTGNPGTAVARTGGKSSGLSAGAKAGIAITVLLLFGFFAGAVGWWFYRKKGKHLFEHEQFDNPIYFSSTKQELHSDVGAVASQGTEKGT